MPTVTFRTTVDDEHVIRAPDGVSIPQGSVEVTIRPVAAGSNAAGSGDSLAGTKSWMLELAREVEVAQPNLPADLAERHDHYAHGKPLP